jgi:hypothetical protein
MDFLDFISSKWTIFTGIFLAAIGIGIREHKLYSVDKAQQAHEKLHKESQFITLQMCTLNQAKMEQLSQVKFDAGAQQFDDIKKLIAANDLANDTRHSEAMKRQDDMMKILLDMNK